MNAKRAKKIRKLLNIELPVKADYRISKKSEKMEYVTHPISGEVEAKKVERIIIVNAAKYQYQQAKKKLKGIKI